MDDGHIGDVIDALETALNVTMTDFDFSGDNAVRRGRYDIKPAGQFVAISNPEIRSKQGPPLSMYERSVTIDIVARAPANSPRPDGYARVALALANQMIEAIEEARESNSTLRDLRTFTIESATLDPGVDGIPSGVAVAWLILSFTYRRPDKREGL